MDSLEELEEFDRFAPIRNKVRAMAAHIDEYAGVPLPLDGEELVVEPSYKFAPAFAPKPEKPRDFKVRNAFWSTRWRIEVFVCEEADGRITGCAAPANYHVDYDLRTLGCSDAWGIEQEARAIQLLATLLPHHRFKQYLLTGMFLETSHRSNVTYMFRKLKPTVAISMAGKYLKPLCALCMHPIAHYAGSWAGAMCPTDDVVAALMMMRGDEALFWRRCNQHAPDRPEAGL